MADGPGAGDLSRFLSAQEPVYSQALAELRAGRKRTHWVWFILPQFRGLGTSDTSRYYAMQSLAEARAYLAHPVLGSRLVECTEALLGVEGRSARQIMGSPDDLKLRSCATLFAQLSPEGSVFHRLLERFFEGERDLTTMALIQGEGA